MVSRRRLLGSGAGALAAPTATAAGLGVPLGEPGRRDAPYDDVRVAASDGTLYVAATDGETLLIACYPSPRDRPVRRDDVEHQLDRRRSVDADRLLVVTSSGPSDGVLATAEHGWRDVGFTSGDELRDLLDGSPIVPPR